MHNYYIQSEEEYKIAEARLEIMAGAVPGSLEAHELKDLTKAVVDYLKNQELKNGLPADKGRFKK